jgi:hypothetical protein
MGGSGKKSAIVSLILSEFLKIPTAFLTHTVKNLKKYKTMDNIHTFINPHINAFHHL